MQHARRIDLAALVLLALPTLAGVALWGVLPARMAIHWSGNTPDTIVAKPIALFGVFLLGVATIAFVRLAPAWASTTPGGQNASVLLVGAVIAWTQGIVLVWNLGYRFDVTLAIVPVLVAVGLVVVYALATGRLG